MDRRNLYSRDTDDNNQTCFDIIVPETGGKLTLSEQELNHIYSGYALLANRKPSLNRYHNDRFLPEINREGHWLFSTLWRYRRYFYSAAAAALLANILTLATTFFTMNVYDRVVPNQAYATLWSLAIGVTLAIIFEFASRQVRAWLIDIAGKKADLILGTTLFRQMMAVKLEFKPRSAGSFANQLREFESVRDFITSVTLSTLSDIPFCILFLFIIYLVGGPLAFMVNAALASSAFFSTAYGQERMLQFTPVGEMPAGRMQKHLQSQTSERTKQPALRPSEKPPLAFTALPDFTGAGMHKRRPAPIAAELRARPRNPAPYGSSHAYFQAMVLKALNHSPEVRGALAEMDASNWNVKQIGGQRYPQVKLGITSPFDTFGSGRTYQHNESPSDSSLSVSVSTPVFDWGKIRAGLKSAKESLNSTALAVKEAREQIAYSTTTELLNLSRYRESLRVASKYADRMHELVNMLSQIADADRGRASELTQARARLLSALASRDQLQHQYDATMIKLVRLLGGRPETPAGLHWNDGMIAGKTALDALAVHPTLLRNEAEARAADAQAESIKAAGLPQLNWVVSKSTAKDSYGEEDAWYTGLNVEWSAFSGGSERAARQAALAKARAAREKTQTSRLELEYQIQNMLETRDSSIKRAGDYERLSVETDKVRLMFYEQWYHLGKRTLLDVLTAESDHFNNQISAINNRFDGYVGNLAIMYNAGILLNWLAE